MLGTSQCNIYAHTLLTYFKCLQCHKIIEFVGLDMFIRLFRGVEQKTIVEKLKFKVLVVIAIIIH